MGSVGSFRNIFWLLWAEVAILYFLSTVILNNDIYPAKLAWTSFITMAIGQAMIEYIVGIGQASVLFTAYVPLAAHPLFYIGYLLFVAGAGIAVLVFFLSIYKAKIDGKYTGSLPLVTWGAVVVAIIALITVFYGLITFSFTLAWRIGLIEMNVEAYRWYYWGLGHDAQYINLAATIVALYALIVLRTGFTAANFINDKYARIAFDLLLIFAIAAIGHHILFDPGFSYIFKQASGSVGSHLLSVPTVLHAFALAGALSATVTASYRTSLFGWIKRIPWGNPAIAAAIFSLISLAYGGTLAQPLTTLQTNLNYHNTLWVNAHFYGTVAGLTTIVFMGLFYYIIPSLISKKLYSVKLSKIQLYTFFIGILILITGMALAGYNGDPRRTFILSDLGLPFWSSYTFLLALGGLIAIAGGIMFVFNMIATILYKGKVGEVFEGMMAKFEIKNTPTKKGAFVLLFIILILIMVLYLFSFYRLGIEPTVY
jgi:cytochrome c oxidase subunit 1